VTDGLSQSEFVEFVRAARMGVVATASPSGKPEAALVEIAVSDCGELIFDTPAGARKLANIERNDQVAVVIGWNDGVSVQVEGTARIVTDDERQRYERLYASQFPGSRVTHPSFEVAVVTPAWVRRYDATSDPARCEHAGWLTGPA
jgi:pyridoxine/pyridoxamine 5'-phosphate oxidase